MRIRTIKPELWEDEKFCQLPFGARLLFIGSLNMSDDYGILRANPIYIKSRLFAYDESLRLHEVAEWLDLLVNSHMFIPIKYNGENYFKIRTFRNHQVISHPGKRTIPKEVEDRLLKEYLSNAPEYSSNFPEYSSSIPETFENSPETSIMLPDDSNNTPEQVKKRSKRLQMDNGDHENYTQSTYTWDEIKDLMRKSELIPESLERRENIPRDKIPELLESFFLRCESTGNNKDRTFRDVATHFDAWATKYWKENAVNVKVNKLKQERTM